MDGETEIVGPNSVGIETAVVGIIVPVGTEAAEVVTRETEVVVTEQVFGGSGSIAKTPTTRTSKERHNFNIAETESI